MRDPQTIAALAIVALTLGIFIYRIFFKKNKSGGCGGGCDCPVKPKAKPKD